MTETQGRQRSSVSEPLPWWTWFLLSGGVLLWMASAILPIVVTWAWGQETVAVIVRVHRHEEGGLDNVSRSVRYCDLQFDGHSVSRRTSGIHRAGERWHMIYRTGNPASVVRGRKSDSVWRVIDLNTNGTALAIASAICALLAYSGFMAGRRGHRSSNSS